MHTISRDTPTRRSTPFVSCEGDVFDVHTIGDGTVSGTFYKATDVANLVGVTGAKVVKATVEDEMCFRFGSDATDPVYISLDGLVQYMFNSRKARKGPYAKWMLDILHPFMQRDDVAIIELAKESLSKTIPSEVAVCFEMGIYLILVGTVEQLQDKCTVPTEADDNHVVVKLGMSKTSIMRRLTAHEGKFPGAERLAVIYMPAELASKAEKAVKDFFHELHDAKPFMYEGQTEVFSLPREKLQSIVGHFTDIAKEVGSVNVKHNLSHTIETLKLNLEHTSDIMKTLEEDKVSLKEETTVLKDEKALLKEENARLSHRLNLISERRDDDQYKHAEELREIRTKLDLKRDTSRKV
ncbi:hypothetical protein SARC_07540 [Sphaeroforma arctica JP610]|uniref:Bro-N domain-containing protein n=1 Tax=Sphaeroforma arctica JP610 TaxID=667725 RepID=A0A0L0FTI4_9EUKA|nr:hypothetical protein SARC_07540 [Sphaeroforma arctica JP610]KNC80097.1 hypothetical protein SARC_07540 [Sphaeroforma arctica JP610]|eukprot:XP_014153999.1 hypothetical protein SARC_07540 [Sphaeroforma arctica JP610]